MEFVILNHYLKGEVLVEAEDVQRLVEVSNDYLFEIKEMEVEDAIKKLIDANFKKQFLDMFDKTIEDIKGLIEKMLETKVDVYQPEVIDNFFEYYKKGENVLGVSQDGELWDMDLVEEMFAVEYFDGGMNRKVLSVDPSNVKRIVVKDEPYSLDEWDGNNFTTGGVGLHEEVYKITEIDDEKIDDSDEPLYLIRHWSQWQGSLPSGKVVSESELMHHLEELERDVEEYMSVIRHL